MCENCEVLRKALALQKDVNEVLKKQLNEVIEIADWAMDKLKERV